MKIWYKVVKNSKDYKAGYSSQQVSSPNNEGYYDVWIGRKGKVWYYRAYTKDGYYVWGPALNEHSAKCFTRQEAKSPTLRWWNKFEKKFGPLCISHHT